MLITPLCNLINRNRSACLTRQTNNKQGGAEMPRPPSIRDSQPVLSDQEQRARCEVLSHPNDMKLLASKMGRDLWENLVWSERLKLLSESMKISTTPPPAVLIEKNNDDSRQSLQIPLPPVDITKDGTASGRLSADGPLPVTNGPETPIDLPVAPSPSFVDTLSASSPLHSEPVLGNSFHREVDFNLDNQCAKPEPKLEKRRSSRRSSIRAKRSERERKAVEKARKDLFDKYNMEVQENLQKVPKGVLKKLKEDNPDFKLMKLISTQDKQKKRRKRVVIIEPDEMVVANPTTGQQVRRMALDRLSAIDYQDKEYGRSVVLRFDGEADAAFIQTEKHITDVSDCDDELMNTTMRMAEQCRVQKKLPPRSIKPIRFPLYRDLLASASHPVDEDCELAVWERSVQASNPPSVIPAVGSLHTKPIHASRSDSIETLETATPHNTIRLSNSMSAVGGKELNIPVATITKSPSSAGQPSSIVATAPVAITESPAAVVGNVDIVTKVSVPKSPSVAAGVQPAASTPPAPTPVLCASATISAPVSTVSFERNSPAALPERIRWIIENNEQVKTLLLKAAGAARKARGGIGPTDSELVGDMITRAEKDVSVRNLLVQTAERVSQAEWNPNEITVYDARERLSSHYESLSVSDKHQFNERITKLKSPVSSSDPKARVVSHTVVNSGDEIPDTSIPSPTTRSVSPIRIHSSCLVHC